jgi:Ras-related protein Rab-1A
METYSTPDYNTDYDYLFKILIIGDSGTGKSAILCRYVDSYFPADYVSTIGVDFKVHTMRLSTGKIAKLQMWDTAGQERFRTITSSYYRGAHGIVITYDTTNRESFNHIRNWLGEIERYSNTDTIKVIVATKSDLITRRTVSTEEGQELATQLGYKFLETSAKNGINVTDIFRTMTEEIRQSYSKSTEINQSQITLSQTQNLMANKNSTCCA